MLSLFVVSGTGPNWLLQDKVMGFIWYKLIFSVGIIIPLGAVFLNIFISYGFLEFVGILMKPLMRPLFRLPGRSALDDLTSWLGSYSVGLYITQKLAREGYYNRRETFIIVTCFSTVSIGFVGVVASTLDLLRFFPLIMGTYFFVTYALAFVLVRMWPINKIPQTYMGVAKPEIEYGGYSFELFKGAMRESLLKAKGSPSYFKTIGAGLRDGFKLASLILGPILFIGTLSVLVVEYTSFFQVMGKPIVPLLKALGLADPELLAPATIAGITEMYIPALMVKTATVFDKFFIAVLSISQLIFFSSVGPMIIEMFKDVPVKVRDLVIMFCLRTIILIPTLSFLTHLYVRWGWLA